MPKVSKLLTDEIVSLAASGLKKPNSLKNKLKLKAIVAAKEHGIKKIAKIYNISHVALIDWIHQLQEGSLEGLNRKPKNPYSRFTKDNKKAIETLLSNASNNMTIETFRIMIKEKLGLKISYSTTYKIMQELGFTYYKKGKKSYSKFKEKSEKPSWRQSKG